MRHYVPHLGVMLAVQSLSSVCVAAIPVLAPAIARDVGIPATGIGMYTMILYSGGIASALIGGALVPRFGAIRTCQAAAVLSAIALLATLSGHVAGLVLCAIILGFGLGPPTPASSHLLFRVTPPTRLGLVLSIKQTGVPIGGALAGALLPALTVLWGWRGAVLAVALASISVVVLLQPWRAGMDADRDPTRPLTLPGVWAGIGLIWRDPDLRLIGMAAAILSAGQVCVSAFYVTYLVEVIGLALMTAGFALSTALVTGAAGRVLWGAVADWSGRPLAIFAGLAATAAAAMLVAGRFSIDQSLVAIHATSAVLGATTIGWAGVAYAEIARRAPAGRAAEASGGITSVMFAGIVVGPAIFGLVASASGFAAAFVAMASVLSLVAMALAWRVARRGAR